MLVLGALLGWRLLAPRAPRPHRIAAVPTATPLPSSAPTPSARPHARISPPAPSISPATPAPTPRHALAPGATPAASTARLAIIVDDCGQWIDTERGFLRLGIPITLAVLPDVRYTATIARDAAAAGDGVMLHLPMQPISDLNPGPGKITTTMSDAQIARRVDADLAQLPEARGVNNHEGSKATSDPRVMRAVMRTLARHGNLFFIDSRTIATTVAAKTAREFGVPSSSRDVFLDDRATVAAVEAQLRLAAAIARKRGSAIAIGHPRPSTLAAVRAMIPILQRQGIRFVLVATLVS